MVVHGAKSLSGMEIVAISESAVRMFAEMDALHSYFTARLKCSVEMVVRWHFGGWDLFISAEWRSENLSHQLAATLKPFPVAFGRGHSALKRHLHAGAGNWSQHQPPPSAWLANTS
jgi:hypothetical protein